MTPKRWFIIAGVLGAVGLLVVVLALATGGSSPRGYIGGHYPRDAAHDIGGEALAYTAGDPPSVVAEDISGEWSPADEYVDGSGVYLRYADDSVVILPLAAGSLILVEALRTAYPRYHGVVGGYWGWNTRDGGDFRGGGPGAGK
jgi:hypothetical protein